MCGEIADTECLAIFVYDSDKVKTDGMHWRVFLPGADGERSFFRVDGLTDLQVAGIGEPGAAQRPDQSLKGWARLLAQAASSKAPLLLRADEPPPRHGVIHNWPPELDAQKKLAVALAADQLSHVRWPPPPPPLVPVG